jgi:glycosyltransferase involved in cell wall biosynthesis
MSESKIPASVGILTLNSAKELPKTLASVAAFDDVFICDGNSTDGTQDIARAHGARVVKQVDTDEPHQKITDFGAARTKCISSSKHSWHVRVDSDEYLSPEVVEEIRNIVAQNPRTRIYKIPRKYVWRGNVINDTITYPNRQMRFYHLDAVTGYTKITHERLAVKAGEQIGILKEPMYVPMPDRFEDFETSRTDRALDWDRRHYEATITLSRWVRATFHTLATLALFSLRMIRVRIFSRGHKFPLSYELWRFRYLSRTLLLATRILLKKSFS